MDIDFSPFFREYEEIVAMADAVFERVKKEYPECVTCKMECSDCCYALFDLGLIEGLYINYHFNKKFKGKERHRLIDKLNRADRDVHRIKKKAYKELKAGEKEDDILMKIAEQRIRCPLLNEQNLCDMYEYRPITCRLYGIPTIIGGKGHTCGKSDFVKGKQYPTVNIDKLQSKLYEISAELVKEIKSKHVKMADMLVPLSMALLTSYNEEYFGLKASKQDSPKEEKKVKRRRK
ncbi:MAG: YkgJ family cysteine cluster protein [Thermodesulfobacteriota bacterium]|nr:YkgJ family cysteine cluster protein [Thermodesulfobacteriota bacterium]